MRKTVGVLVIGAIAAAGAPTPARADPAVPTNYESEVISVDPTTEAVAVEILGGDAFLHVAADPGTEVMVYGYDEEPYLRIDPDGTVWANIHSPAHYLNDDRYAVVALPPLASTDADPKWQQIGEGGAFSWHDHRIHWMAPIPPPGVDFGEATVIQEWVVPIEVDGVPTTIAGRLSWLPSTSPIPSLGIILIGATAMFLLSRSRRLALPMILGGAGALVVGLAQVLSSPLGFGGELMAWLPPLIVLGLGIVLAVRGPSLILAAVGTALLVVWTAPRLPTLYMPVLPTGLTPAVERSAMAIALASTVVLGIVLVDSLVRRGGRTP